MDTELLVALVVLWFSTTTALITFLRMWFSYHGESFHPHSVDVEHRHGLFLVVNSKTQCKIDCMVKSISVFVAPRGSSSSKQFTVLSVMIAVAGFLGTSRWVRVADVSNTVATLTFLGFSSLLFIAAFEMDVIPERYLEDKLVVTGWLIEKLGYKTIVPFKLRPCDEGFRTFIRSSQDIYHLYDEDIYLQNRPKKYMKWTYHSLWSILHMYGACGYIVFVPIAIMLHDSHETKVVYITAIMFGCFLFMSYLTGEYVPVLSYFKGWVLMWNPFLKEPHFLLKLKRVSSRI